jgi:hypothetical protein
MLKDNIEKNINVIKDLSNLHINAEPFWQLHGELEIEGRRGGKLFHYDKQDNKITIWAKHATMHMITGESFSQIGTSRLTAAGNHGDTAGDSSYNRDGTLVSGEQYFANPTFPGTNDWWARPVVGDSTTHLYPYFPTKMLFGTGFEWRSWATIGDSDYYTYYTATDGWAEAEFDHSSITNAANNYSADYDTTGDSLNFNRTMNDIYSGTLTTPAITDSDYAIKGAIKNGLYESSVDDTAKIDTISGNYFSIQDYWGVGRPAFIYAKRESRFYQSGAEVALNFDSNVENKITYTVTMPEQTGAFAGNFYPYNGFVLKEAGLFTDSGFRLKDTTPPNDAGSDDSSLTEFDNYSSMPYGMLFAKRYIAPITKSHDVSITARWTIYL